MIIAVGHAAVSTADEFNYQVNSARAYADSQHPDPQVPFMVPIMFQLFVDE
jgi:hypothetical protein